MGKRVVAYKPVVTVCDVLEAGACLNGALAFVKKHKTIAIHPENFLDEELIVDVNNKWNCNGYGNGSYGNTYDGDGYGCGSGRSYGYAYTSGAGYGTGYDGDGYGCGNGDYGGGYCSDKQADGRGYGYGLGYSYNNGYEDGDGYSDES